MNEDGISSGGIVSHEDCRGEGGGKGGGLTPPKLAKALQSQQPLMRLITQDHNWQPAVDLHHGHAEFFIIIDLPGLKIPDIKISRTGARLLLHGSRRIPCAPQIRAGLPLPATVPYHLLQLSSRILLLGTLTRATRWTSNDWAGAMVRLSSRSKSLTDMSANGASAN